MYIVSVVYSGLFFRQLQFQITVPAPTLGHYKKAFRSHNKPNEFSDSNKIQPVESPYNINDDGPHIMMMNRTQTTPD